MTVLYFTATGNGLYIAKTIGGTLVSIPGTVKQGGFDFKDDKIGIVFPIYGWGVPMYIRDFLGKVRPDSPYIFAVMSYGMVSGAAAGQLLKLGADNNIHFSYINTIKMVDNYLPGFDMEQQIKTEPEKQIDQHLGNIISDINNGRRMIRRDSFLEKIISKPIWKIDHFRTGVGITDKIHVEDTCTECGICAKVCPVDNIQVNNTKPLFGQQCVTCLACTQNCPQNAIRISGEKSRARFRNRHIKLSEIIEANS